MKPLERIAAINAQPWRPVSGLGMAVAAALTAYIAFFALRGDGWVPLLDSANLAVHEGGHPLVGLFSTRLAVYGGTFAQLFFPAACMFEFWRRREALSCGICGIWLGQSLLNVARYMADARAMQLPIVGFGESVLHDWNLILSRWGLLRYDVILANGLRALAWLAIAASIAFLIYRRSPR